MYLENFHQSLFSVKYQYLDTETSLALVSSIVIGYFWNVYSIQFKIMIISACNCNGDGSNQGYRQHFETGGYIPWICNITQKFHYLKPYYFDHLNFLGRNYVSRPHDPMLGLMPTFVNKISLKKWGVCGRPRLPTNKGPGLNCNENGFCSCKANIINKKCDACAPGFSNFPTCPGK